MAAFFAGIFVGRHSGYCKEVGRLLLIGSAATANHTRDGVFRMLNRSFRAKAISRAIAGAFATLALVLSPLLATFATSATAASLVSSVPSAGAVLTVAPSAVVLTTDVTLLDQGNSVTVTDPAGNRVDDGSLTIDSTNATVGLGTLSRSGMYKVSYTLVPDGDTPVSGSYSFMFSAPASISTPSPTPTPTVSASATPASTASGSSGGKIFVIVLLVISFFIIIFLIWYARMIIRDVKDRGKKSANTAKPRTRSTQSRAKKLDE